MARPFKRAQAAQNRRFLKALARTGNVRLAARKLGVHRGTYTKRRARCPAFAARWDAALAAAQSHLFLPELPSGIVEGHEPPPSSRAKSRGVRKEPEPSAPRRTRGGEPMILRLGNGRLQLREALPGRMTAEAFEEFLDVLDDTANIRFAAEAVGVAHSSILARARRDPGFAAIVAETVAEASARLPAVADALTEQAAREARALVDARPGWPRGVTVAQALHALRGHR